MLDGIMQLSASQIDTYLSCARKWSFIYQDKLESPPSPSAELGSAVHAQLEAFFRHGKPLDFTSEAGYIAAPALSYLPSTGSFDIEHAFNFRSNSSGHEYRGYIDLRDKLSHTVYDHKTSSNIYKWAKKPEDLLYDAQAVLYTVASIIDWRVPEVTLQWTYMQTRGAKKASPVRLKMSADHAGEVFAIIESVADEIAAIKGKKRTLELAPTIATCSAFGGCPFQSRCNLSPSERTQAVMSNTTGTNDLFSRLQRKNTLAMGTVSTQRSEPILPPPVEDIPINPPESTLPYEDTKPTENSIQVAEPVSKKRGQRATSAANARRNLEGKLITRLYIDCVPSTTHMRFDALLSEASRTLESSHNVTDYRLIEYGKGAPLLVSALLEALRKNEGCAELVVRSSTPEASVCLNMLMANADVVITGG